MKLFLIFLIISLQSCVTSNEVIAQKTSSKDKSYATQKVSSDLSIDGVFNDLAWGKVKWSSGFTIKGNPTDEKYDTKFKIVYDNSNIYIAIHCLDIITDSIPLYPSLRDNTSNDWVEIDFDSNLDKETGYAFVVSPYGVRTDMFISGDDADFDDSWHPNWEVKTKVEKTGWNAEMKIPFDQLIINEEIQNWGLQITRRITRREEYSNWESMPEGTKGWVSQFGKLKGIHSIQGKKNENIKYNHNRLVDPKDLKEDLKLLQSVLEDIYPDLYRYTSKEDMDQLFETTTIELDKPLTEVEFYKRLTPIFNAIGDGHSWIRPSRDYIKYLLSEIKMLPIGIKIVNNEIFMTKSFSPSVDVQKGMKIISINGIKSKELIQELSNYIAADGYNKTWKLDGISNDFSFYLQYLLGSQDKFLLQVISPISKKVKSISINGLLEDEWIKNTLPKNPTPFGTDNWNYHLLNDSTGYLSLFTFARGRQFRDHLDKLFQKIRSDHITNLVIDLRYNYGGNDVNGKYLFSYLAKEPFYYQKDYEVNSKLPLDLLDKIECCISFEELDFLKVVSSINSDGKRIITNYEKTGYDNPNEISLPKENSFDGNVYLITNGGSFSVTSDFVSLVHNTKRGIVIGEETGGGYYGNTSGIDKLLILPNSKLRANINFIKYINHRESGLNQKGRGVLPHFEIQPSQEDIAKGIDRELIFTLEMIESENKN